MVYKYITDWFWEWTIVVDKHELYNKYTYSIYNDNNSSDWELLWRFVIFYRWHIDIRFYPSVEEEPCSVYLNGSQAIGWWFYEMRCDYFQILDNLSKELIVKTYDTLLSQWEKMELYYQEIPKWIVCSLAEDNSIIVTED